MDLYREEILEHWQNPQNFGKMRDADVVIEQTNPLCGDVITMYFKLDKKRLTIDDVRFTASGCAISIAAASILSGALKGKKAEKIEKMTGEDVLGLIGAKRQGFPPARLRCALLPLEAVRRIFQ